MTGVSRETLERLKTYEALVRKWTPRVNLISASTIDDLWHRHIEDSLQLLDCISEEPKTWVDLGSGGGFPGVVIAIAAPEISMTLIESDARKCAFLQTALRETGTQATVLNKRIEQAPPSSADIVSARALAALPKLIELANPHLRPGGILLAPKGANHREEVESALENWSFHCEYYPSKTNPNSSILGISGIERI